jgi:hypothetical protein
MPPMSPRLKSIIATTLIQGALFYALIMGLAMTFTREPPEKLSAVTFTPKAKPPPPPVLPLPKAPIVRVSPVAAKDRPVILGDWSAAGPAQRNQDFMKATKWVRDNMPEAERRLERWKAAVPQGSGPGKVTRERPANLATHTLYWPAQWSRGPLPIVAWGNGNDGMCSNSSLSYAAFLAEIASHGYFVVAVGNDDIDYPQPEGIEILADGRPIRTQASALRKAVDWAVAENGRGGSPYAGKLDTDKIAYMGHGCGGLQALSAASDPRAKAAVLLNSAAALRPEATKASLAQFEGQQDEQSVLAAAEANFAKAQAAGRTMYKAALAGVGHSGAYPGPDRRWSGAVLAWLNWQLKGDAKAAATFVAPARPGWSRIQATGIGVEAAKAQ